MAFLVYKTINQGNIYYVYTFYIYYLIILIISYMLSIFYQKI